MAPTHPHHTESHSGSQLDTPTSPVEAEWARARGMCAYPYPPSPFSSSFPVPPSPRSATPSHNTSPTAHFLPLPPIPQSPDAPDRRASAPHAPQQYSLGDRRASLPVGGVAMVRAVSVPVLTYAEHAEWTASRRGSLARGAGRRAGAARTLGAATVPYPPTHTHAGQAAYASWSPSSRTRRRGCLSGLFDHVQERTDADEDDKEQDTMSVDEDARHLSSPDPEDLTTPRGSTSTQGHQSLTSLDQCFAYESASMVARAPSPPSLSALAITGSATSTLDRAAAWRLRLALATAVEDA